MFLIIMPEDRHLPRRRRARCRARFMLFSLGLFSALYDFLQGFSVGFVGQCAGCGACGFADLRLRLQGPGRLGRRLQGWDFGVTVTV